MRGILVLAWLLEASVVRAQERESSYALRAAREAERVARLELEAAKSKEFYFLVDVSASTLTLKLMGVPLASYPIESVEIGLPLVRPSAEEPAEKEVDAQTDDLEALYACTAPSIHPLSEITPGPPPDPNSSEAEESADELDAPHHVALTCEPPLAVHVVSTSSVLGLRERLRLPGDREGELRVRLTLGKDDAENLFSSLPSKALFLFSRAPAKPTQSTASTPR